MGAKYSPASGATSVFRLKNQQISKNGEGFRLSLANGFWKEYDAQGRLLSFEKRKGELFGVNLTPANRYGGFKALRERWREHIAKTLFRPVLFIDEAQEMASACLNELRLLGSAHFDSQCLLTVILCG